jgi:hypothetical protein
MNLLVAIGYVRVIIVTKVKFFFITSKQIIIVKTTLIYVLYKIDYKQLLLN